MIQLVNKCLRQSQLPVLIYKQSKILRRRLEEIKKHPAGKDDQGQALTDVYVMRTKHNASEQEQIEILKNTGLTDAQINVIMGVDIQ